MKSKTITIIGGLIVLAGMFFPWIERLGGKTFYGFSFLGLNEIVDLHFIIITALILIVVVLALTNKKRAGLFMLIIGLIITGWGIVIRFAVEAFGISYIWREYSAEWLGEAAGSFLNIGRGVYLVIIGGILVIIGGVLKLKGEIKISPKVKKIIIIILLISGLIYLGKIGRRWFFKQQYEEDKSLMEKAIESDNPEKCEKIELLGQRNSCYKYIAVSIGDLSLCDKIEDQDTVKYFFCYSEVAARNEDPSICEELEDRSAKNNCYHLVAEATHNTDLCDKMTSIFFEECYRDVARETKDVNICGRITNPNFKNWCYTDVAIATEDITICEQYPVDRSFCYRQLAKAKKDPSLCEYIHASSQPWRDWCFDDLAELLKDPKICEGIKDQTTKDRCYKSVGK